MIGKVNPSKEVDAGSEALNKNLVRMKEKLEPYIAKKSVNVRHHAFQIVFVTGKELQNRRHIEDSIVPSSRVL